MFDVINSDIIKVIPRAQLDSSYNLIEGCESAGAIGRDYVIVVEKARVNELVDELCCGKEKNKADIMKRLNLNILPDLILGTCDDDESDEVDTLTEYLVLKLGSMDNVLMHYGLLTKTPEEKAVEDFVNNHDLLEEATTKIETSYDIDADYDDDYDPEDDDLEGIVDDFIDGDDNFGQFRNFREELKEDEEEEEESENAYSMLHKLEEQEEEREDILAPSNLYTDKGEEDMYQNRGFCEPPSTMGSSIKKDEVLSIQTKNIYEKEEVTPVPTSNVSEYIKVEAKEEEREVDTEETLVLKQMVKVMCEKMNFNYEEVLAEAEHQVELAKNPNFTEEELKSALSKLLCASVISGVEHDFYVANFESGQVETVTKIIREKLQSIEGSL